MKPFILLVLLQVVLASFISRADRFPKAKDIEKGFVQISEKKWVGKYEISNADYKRFTDFLKSTKQEALYSKCLLDSALEFRGSDNVSLKYLYSSHRTFESFPVVAVSYDGANEYCKWLTVQYNSDGDRKFKKVVFRLPTEQEWTEAASSGDSSKMYPWNGLYLRNRDGMFLCNFHHMGDEAIYYDPATKSYKIAEERMDGAVALPNPVNSHQPSPNGLYNLSGNAAEMVAEKGLAKGGSYNDPGYDVRISSKKYYESPSTEIGFRVLMEVLEK